MESQPLLKVLIVDDLRSAREEFSSICRDFIPSVCIDEASNVMEAMKLIQKEDPPYDAIFTDINMPEINGLKLISMTRHLAAYRTAPIVVISTLAGNSDIESAMQLGASGYLTRPLQKGDFEVVYVAFLRPIVSSRKKKQASQADVAIPAKMLK